MKAILPWVVAVLAIGAAGILFKSNQTRSAKLEQLQLEVQELEAVRGELNQLKSEQIPAVEIAQLRKDREDLIRLRNEVTKLRNEQLQLSKQAQTAANALAGAQQQAQQLQQLQAENQQLRGVAQGIAQLTQQQVAALNACINNLRQLDGAKQQWALERQKTAEALPAGNDIAEYLQGGAIPVCPAGGKYTLNAVGDLPVCSINGHALPQQ